MTREEAALYLDLLRIAFDHGEGNEQEYKLGMRLRDRYFPNKYEHLFEDL